MKDLINSLHPKLKAPAMRWFLRVALINFLFFVLFLCACDPVEQQDAKSGRPLVYASFYPIYDFTKKAAGDFAEVRCLIPYNAEPHDWEPLPKDVAGLKKADLFFYSGDGFEGWVPTVLGALGESAPVVLETSAEIYKAHELHESHGHADAHVWLSPKLAKIQFTSICETLMQTDPENAAEYEDNLKKYSAEFDALDKEFDALRVLPKKTVVVTHDAFSHLCGDYGLAQISIAGASPDDEPDPSRMAKVISQAKESGVRVVFYEELASAKIAQAVAKELHAKILPLSPLEGLSDKQRANGDDYFSVMRQNLAVLKEALS